MKSHVFLSSNSPSASDQSNVSTSSEAMIDDTRGITRQYNTACLFFFFYSNYDPTRNNLEAENIAHDHFFHELACILIIYPNDRFFSIIRCLSFYAKYIPNHWPLLFSIVLVKGIDSKLCRIDYGNKEVTTGLLRWFRNFKIRH